MRYFSALLSLLLLAATPDISGTWQGTIDGPTGHVRRVMAITKSNGGYEVTIHSIDESEVPIVTHNVKVNGTTVTMTFDMNTDPWMDYHRIYRAKVNANGTSIDGTWTIPQGPKIAMNYHRVAHASWKIIEPKSHFVEVGNDVKDEVLDWGGIGRPVVLLAGLGNTAHSFFQLAPGLTAKYHVYSVTRRGFGNSSKPAATDTNYSADRLGDDVIDILDALKIQKPVLIGHSIAGEELSDIGTRFPHKVSALIYLDAGYYYAFDSGVRPPEPTPPPGAPPMPPIGKAIIAAGRKFRGPIDDPILAIFAYPHNPQQFPPGERTPEKIKERNADDNAAISAFERGLPNAKVIRIPNADHFIYISNTQEVLSDINTFIGALP